LTEQAIIRAVVGLRGYGKSTKVTALAKSFPRVFYYDTMGNDYMDGVICRDLRVLERFWRGVYRLPFRIVYRPQDPVADFPRICELIWECGCLLFVVDEVQMFSHGAYAPFEFTRIVTGGRHRDINLIGVTQAPKKLGELLRSQAHEWFVFGVREPDQAHYLSERLAGVSDDVFRMLEKFQYVHYVDGADECWVCKDVPATGGMEKLLPVLRDAKAVTPGPAGEVSQNV
jgi:hypothetical protein